MADMQGFISEDHALSVSHSSKGRFVKAAVTTAAVLMGVVATAAAATMTTLKYADASAFQNKQEMMVVKPAYENCASKPSENCLESRCCGASGYNCFKTSAVKGQCMKSCTPGGLNGTCEGVAPHMSKVVENPGMSLYCFTAYTDNTGSSKPTTELKLLQLQYKIKAGIFSCADYVVYSDVAVPVGDDVMTIQLHDVKGDWHWAKRKTVGTWINTGMYVQIWDAMRASGKYLDHNWVVKADADAIFFPHKLINQLQGVPVPEQGVYFENCQYVDWGYFGSMEVYSKQAFNTLAESLDECYTALPWKVGVHHGKYGPMGEDLFAQKCMDLKGVAKVEKFELTSDGTCEDNRPAGQKKNKKWKPTCAGNVAPAIHPFKKPQEWIECFDAAAPAW